MVYLKLFMCIGNHVCVLLQIEYLQAEQLVLPGVQVLVLVLTRGKKGL